VAVPDPDGNTAAVGFLLRVGTDGSRSGPCELTVARGAPARDLMRRAVTRRLALRAGACAALTAGAGGVGWWVLARDGEGNRPLRAAGWKGLFLTQAGTHPRWPRAGVRIDADSFQELSGYESLSLLDPRRLRELVFVTCPNEAVAAEIQQKASRALGRAVGSTAICTDSMVVLARGDRLPALRRSGILVRVRSGAVCFDLARYVDGRCARRWSAYDPELVADAGSLVTLYGADPLRAASEPPGGRTCSGPWWTRGTSTRNGDSRCSRRTGTCGGRVPRLPVVTLPGRWPGRRPPVPRSSWPISSPVSDR